MNLCRLLTLLPLFACLVSLAAAAQHEEEAGYAANGGETLSKEMRAKVGHPLKTEFSETPKLYDDLDKSLSKDTPDATTPIPAPRRSFMASIVGDINLFENQSILDYHVSKKDSQDASDKEVLGNSSYTTQEAADLSTITESADDAENNGIVQTKVESQTTLPKSSETEPESTLDANLAAAKNTVDEPAGVPKSQVPRVPNIRKFLQTDTLGKFDPSAVSKTQTEVAEKEIGLEQTNGIITEESCLADMQSEIALEPNSEQKSIKNESIIPNDDGLVGNLSNEVQHPSSNSTFSQPQLIMKPRAKSLAEHAKTKEPYESDSAVTKQENQGKTRISNDSLNMIASKSESHTEKITDDASKTKDDDQNPWTRTTQESDEKPKKVVGQNPIKEIKVTQLDRDPNPFKSNVAKLRQNYEQNASQTNGSDAPIMRRGLATTDPSRRRTTNFDPNEIRTQFSLFDSTQTDKDSIDATLIEEETEYTAKEGEKKAISIIDSEKHEKKPKSRLSLPLTPRSEASKPTYAPPPQKPSRLYRRSEAPLSSTVSRQWTTYSMANSQNKPNPASKVVPATTIDDKEKEHPKITSGPAQQQSRLEKTIARNTVQSAIATLSGREKTQRLSMGANVSAETNPIYGSGYGRTTKPLPPKSTASELQKNKQKLFGSTPAYLNFVGLGKKGDRRDLSDQGAEKSAEFSKKHFDPSSVSKSNRSLSVDDLIQCESEYTTLMSKMIYDVCVDVPGNEFAQRIEEIFQEAKEFHKMNWHNEDVTLFVQIEKKRDRKTQEMV